MPGAPDLDRRTYDLLRLVDAHEPIGSIRLTERMHCRGYRIEDRTVRLALADLDDGGLTTKVPGRGRELTAAGRAELDRGDVSGRLSRVRERIATLTSAVTYDPTEDVGDLVAGAVLVPRESLSAVFDVLRELDGSPLGPVPTAVADDSRDRVRLAFPSSITLDGVLLSWGIDADLTTAGLVEYRGTSSDGDGTDDVDRSDDTTGDGTGGEIVRYVDAISGEGSTMDVVELLIEAGRTDVTAALGGGTGVLVVDNREFPLARYGEARDLAAATARSLGGVVDVRRPREPGPFPLGSPGWEFGSLTYGGIAEATLALLREHELADEWETLAGISPRSDFHPLATARATIEDRPRLDGD